MSITGAGQQVVIELDGRGQPLDTGQIAADVEMRLDREVGVEFNLGGDFSDAEVEVHFGDTMVSKEEVMQTQRAVRQANFDSPAPYQVSGWRIEIA